MIYIVPLGRVLYAAIFVLALPGHFSSGTIAYAAGKGVPLAAIAVPLSGIIAFVGAVSIILGLKARWGAWLLVLFLVPVTIMIHNFWAVPDPQAAHMQYLHFIKNVSMLGGALLIAWFGPGPVSFDNR
jgi:putative oxidoreductase